MSGSCNQRQAATCTPAMRQAPPDPSMAGCAPAPAGRLSLALAGILTLAFALSACGGGGGGVRETIFGSITLISFDGLVTNPAPCHGTGGFDDISNGAQVVVSDGNGKVLGTSMLTNATTQARTRCRLEYRVPGLPKVAFYQIEVTHRGKIVKSFHDLDLANWHVDSTLG